MSSSFLIIGSWLLFPVYVIQGLWVRARSMRLSPAEGPLSGQFGEGGADFRILTIGDSSCAGVGVPETASTVAPSLARHTYERSGKTVSWNMSGHNSAVAGEIRDIVVPNLEEADYTHIFIMIGTNDIKNWHTGKRWKREFGGLLYALRTRFPRAQIYWHQAIDFNEVPALPQPLAMIMNWRRILFNRKGAQLCLERGVVAIPPLPDTQPEGYCEDGFHANSAGYDAWASHMIDYLDYTPKTSPAVAGLAGHRQVRSVARP